MISPEASVTAPSVNGAHLRGKARLDTERHERITNHRPRVIPDRGSDYGIGIDEDHASCAIRQHAAKLLGHLSCNFNAGKTRTDDHNGRAPPRCRASAEGRNMGVEPNPGRVGINVKAVRPETGNRGAHQLAAQG